VTTVEINDVPATNVHVNDGVDEIVVVDAVSPPDPQRLAAHGSGQPSRATIGEHD
jgi:hypothetical protein